MHADRNGQLHHDTRRRSRRRLWATPFALLLCVSAAVLFAAPRDPFTLDRAAQRWVEQTLKTLTPDEKIGQLIVPSFESNFLSTDSDTFETLSRLVREYHVGGLHVFGASQPAPSVLLNSGYGTVTLGQPFSAAFLINRLQALSSVPLLNTADFETGVGFRIFGADFVDKAGRSISSAGDPSGISSAPLPRPSNGMSLSKMEPTRPR